MAHKSAFFVMLGALVTLYGWRTLAFFQARRILKRLDDRIAHPEKYADEPPAPRLPESLVVVHLSDAEVVCERPDGKTERVAWAGLRSVDILTTADGPFAPDVFFLLIGTVGGCAVPQGATGYEALLQRLQALPGFDNEAFIRAMGSTEEASFACWRAPVATTAL